MYDIQRYLSFAIFAEFRTETVSPQPTLTGLCWLWSRVKHESVLCLFDTMDNALTVFSALSRGDIVSRHYKLPTDLS